MGSVSLVVSKGEPLVEEQIDSTEAVNKARLEEGLSELDGVCDALSEVVVCDMLEYSELVRNGLKMPASMTRVCAPRNGTSMLIVPKIRCLRTRCLSDPFSVCKIC